MTTAEARRLFGNDNRIAKILGLHRSSVGRWKRMVPQEHVPKLEVHAKVLGIMGGTERYTRIEVACK